ncbi:hypothetical protein G3435_23850, partial [Pseudomonas sp. MAFF212428]|nr:hypothetical protein [Pseudomonas brassicae]
NIDQAITGHTTAQRQAGVLGALQSAINTLFNATLLKGRRGRPRAHRGRRSACRRPHEHTGPADP